MTQEVTDPKQQLSERVDRMTRVLRALGAVLLLTSASSFLIHRWDTGNDMVRYGFLLAHSFVILAAALFCSGKLGESRSARLFLWTNLAMVPTHFAVLGGLVYSRFALDASANELPKYAVWVAPDNLSVILAAIGAFLTTIPTSLISARVLAPRRAKVVTFSYVGLCALLLVPVRAPDFVAVLAAVGTGFALFAERKWFAKDYRTRTAEGRFVRALMGVPVTLLVVRTAAFYDMSSMFLGLLIMVAGLCGWVIARSMEAGRANIEAAEWLVGLDAFDDIGPLCLLSLSALLFVASRFSRVTRGSFEVATALTGLGVCSVALILKHTLIEGGVAVCIGGKRPRSFNSPGASAPGHLSRRGHDGRCRRHLRPSHRLRAPIELGNLVCFGDWCRHGRRAPGTTS